MDWVVIHKEDIRGAIHPYTSRRHEPSEGIQDGVPFHRLGQVFCDAQGKAEGLVVEDRYDYDWDVLCCRITFELSYRLPPIPTRYHYVEGYGKGDPATEPIPIV